MDKLTSLQYLNSVTLMSWLYLPLLSRCRQFLIVFFVFNAITMIEILVFCTPNITHWYLAQTWNIVTLKTLNYLCFMVSLRFMYLFVFISLAISHIVKMLLMVIITDSDLSFDFVRHIHHLWAVSFWTTEVFDLSRSSKNYRLSSVINSFPFSENFLLKLSIALHL